MRRLLNILARSFGTACAAICVGMIVLWPISLVLDAEVEVGYVRVKLKDHYMLGLYQEYKSQPWRFQITECQFLRPFDWRMWRDTPFTPPTFRDDSRPAYTLYDARLPLPFVSACGVVLLVVGRGASVLRRRWLVQGNRCPSCGYSMTGLSTGVCPECGKGPSV